MEEKTIGILGGMGPEASVDMFSKIITSNPVTKDQEQLRIIVYCNSKIPPRSQATLSRGEDPRPELIRSAELLEASGAGLVVIACNAAHFFHTDIQKSVSIPVLHIMREVAGEIQHSAEQFKTVGLLAGTTTVKTGLYDEVLEEIGVRVLSPDMDEEQERVNSSIYEIKKGNKGVKQILVDIAEKMAAKGAQAIILGCTEVPLVIRDGDLSVPVIDATQVLADAAIRMAKAGG